jgi:hypothetical protein
LNYWWQLASRYSTSPTRVRAPIPRCSGSMCPSGNLQRLRLRIRRSDFEPKAALSGLENNYPEQGVENLRSAGVKGGGYSCFLARPLSCQRHFGCGALRCRGAFRRIDRPTPGDSILPSHLRHSEGPLRNSDWSWSPTSLHSTRGRWPFNLPLKASNRHPRSDGRQRQQASREELFDQGFPHGSPLPLGWKSTASGERAPPLGPAGLSTRTGSRTHHKLLIINGHAQRRGRGRSSSGCALINCSEHFNPFARKTGFVPGLFAPPPRPMS